MTRALAMATLCCWPPKLAGLSFEIFVDLDELCRLVDDFPSFFLCELPVGDGGLDVALDIDKAELLGQMGDGIIDDLARRLLENEEELELLVFIIELEVGESDAESHELLANRHLEGLVLDVRHVVADGSIGNSPFDCRLHLVQPNGRDMGDPGDDLVAGLRTDDGDGLDVAERCDGSFLCLDIFVDMVRRELLGKMADEVDRRLLLVADIGDIRTDLGIEEGIGRLRGLDLDIVGRDDLKEVGAEKLLGFGRNGDKIDDEGKDAVGDAGIRDVRSLAKAKLADEGVDAIDDSVDIVVFLQSIGIDDMIGIESDERNLDLQIGQRELDVLVDRHVRIKGVVLEDQSNASLLGREVGDFLVTEPDFAGSRLEKAGDHVEGRGLSATGGAKEADQLSVRNLEVEVVDGDGVADVLLRISREDLGEVLELDFHFSLSPISFRRRCYPNRDAGVGSSVSRDNP